jgi:hypothetical protein
MTKVFNAEITRVRWNVYLHTERYYIIKIALYEVHSLMIVCKRHNEISYWRWRISAGLEIVFL